MVITRRDILAAGAAAFYFSSTDIRLAQATNRSGSASQSIQRAQFKVAAIQAESVYLDLRGGVEKAARLIAQAADQGASLVAFPELWLPGYPFGHESSDWKKARLKTYVENSLQIGGDEWKAILVAARQNNILVSIGYSERDGDYLYIGQALIGDDGVPIQIRRKLRPSGSERTIWSDGDASVLKVLDTRLGRIGSLSCWEHMHPQMTYIMQAQMEHIHIGAWPILPEADGFAWASPAINLAAARYYTTLTSATTIVPCGLVGERMFEEFQAFAASSWVPKGGGNARIFGPDGLEISQALSPGEEGILVATVDPAKFSAKSHEPNGEFSFGVLKFITDNYPGPRIADQDHGRINLVPIGAL
ncbi:nitrilase [Agrobacterium tumefaciens]|uniref:nitrilase-related carbon-nitrogen hydrolase n=1 Tax=Agrobacterium tumefaciens TaxID=358 RepID=UPI001572C0E2|nr:nitrilase-related carbon-nitrogen hydrolase [Agrobacterium tumefaciens]UXT20479.1 nitrilase [Agrobacterium tumefaciens]WHO20729.1 nitrilase-related carbon-nitrogen hydrolase [Agrobacterium tumefaciens]WHO23514.1 nitrilase-related carbon-nitrogen hydrolase [Agrobacterium tumefaciens]